MTKLLDDVLYLLDGTILQHPYSPPNLILKSLTYCAIRGHDPWWYQSSKVCGWDNILDSFKNSSFNKCFVSTVRTLIQAERNFVVKGGRLGFEGICHIARDAVVCSRYHPPAIQRHCPSFAPPFKFHHCPNCAPLFKFRSSLPRFWKPTSEHVDTAA